MSKPRILDLFCKEGGAGKGYADAGLEVLGVDIEPQPRYPLAFVQRDALSVLENWSGTLRTLGAFDAIHASPPCQAHSRMSNCRPGLADSYPELIAPVRNLLESIGLPYVIENVPGAPMRPDVKLCGCMFGLRSERGGRGLQVRRERWFELGCGWPVPLTPGHDHSEPALPMTGHSPGKEWMVRNAEYGPAPRIEERRQAMGVPWMTREGQSEAIPPAFSEYLGRELVAAIERRVVA